MLQAYRSSGKFGSLSLLYVPSLVAAGVGLAWPYGELAIRSGSGSFNAGFAVAFLAGIFGMVWLVMRFGKCRNHWLAVLIGFLVGCAAAGAVHAWMYAAWSPVNPSQTFVDMLEARASRGWEFGTSRKKVAISGGAAYACWGLEILLTILAGMAGGLIATQSPFCEACNAWVDKRSPELSIPGLPEAVIKSVRQAPSVEDVLSPSLRRLRADQRWLCYNLRVCPWCAQSAFLTVEIKELRRTLTGKQKESCTEIHSNVLIEPWHIEAFEELRRDVDVELKLQKPEFVAGLANSGRTDVG